MLNTLGSILGALVLVLVLMALWLVLWVFGTLCKVFYYFLGE